MTVIIIKGKKSHAVGISISKGDFCWLYLPFKVTCVMKHIYTKER